MSWQQPDKAQKSVVVSGGGSTDTLALDMKLATDVSQFFADPLGFVLYAFDWGHGDLKGFDGPDDWQIDILNTIGREVLARGFDGVNAVEPVRVAVASGHG